MFNEYDMMKRDVSADAVADAVKRSRSGVVLSIIALSTDLTPRQYVTLSKKNIASVDVSLSSNLCTNIPVEAFRNLLKSKEKVAVLSNLVKNPHIPVDFFESAWGHVLSARLGSRIANRINSSVSLDFVEMLAASLKLDDVYSAEVWEAVSFKLSDSGWANIYSFVTGERPSDLPKGWVIEVMKSYMENLVS